MAPPLAHTLEDQRTKGGAILLILEVGTKGGAILLILISTSKKTFMGPLEALLTHTAHSTHMYLLNFTSCLTDQENSPCNL